MTFNELLKEHFQYMPGLCVVSLNKDCMIWWTTAASAIDGGEMALDLSRDSLIIRLTDGVVTIKRVDAGNRILHDEPWKTLDPCDPQLLSEIHKMVKSL